MAKYQDWKVSYSSTVWYRREPVDARLFESSEQGLREFLDWAGSGACEVFGYPVVLTSTAPVVVTGGKWVVREADGVFAVYSPEEMRRTFVREDVW